MKALGGRQDRTRMSTINPPSSTTDSLIAYPTSPTASRLSPNQKHCHPFTNHLLTSEPACVILTKSPLQTPRRTLRLRGWLSCSSSFLRPSHCHLHLPVTQNSLRLFKASSYSITEQSPPGPFGPAFNLDPSYSRSILCLENSHDGFRTCRAIRKHQDKR